MQNVAGTSYSQAKQMGLTFYFGKVCEHHPELNGLRYIPGCVKCVIERSTAFNRRRFEEEAPARLAARRRKKELADAERERERPAKMEERRKNYRKWYAKNAKKVREKCRDWRANNIQHRAACRAARRAELKCAMPKVSRTQLRRINKAFMAAKVLAARLEELHGFPFHVDHIIPLALGGHHEPSNWQIISAEDNLRKHARADFTDYQWPRWLIGE